MYHLYSVFKHIRSHGLKYTSMFTSHYWDCLWRRISSKNLVGAMVQHMYYISKVTCFIVLIVFYKLYIIYTSLCYIILFCIFSFYLFWIILFNICTSEKKKTLQTWMDLHKIRRVTHRDHVFPEFYKTLKLFSWIRIKDAFCFWILVEICLKKFSFYFLGFELFWHSYLMYFFIYLLFFQWTVARLALLIY